MGTNPFITNDTDEDRYFEAEDGLTFDDDTVAEEVEEEIPTVESDKRSDEEREASSRPRRYNSPDANALVEELKLAGQKSADQLARTLEKPVDEIYSLLELLRRRGQVVVDQKFARKDRRTYSLTADHDTEADGE